MPRNTIPTSLSAKSTLITRITALTAALLVVAGCIKREEIIAILPDGSAYLFTHIEGDPTDVEEGDAMPTERSGWRVSDRIETDQEHKKTQFRTAQRRTAARESIPDSYAAPGDPATVTCLRFPTTVTVEHRPDGVYYHFRRIYEGRQFAQVSFWQEHIFETDDIQKISKKSPEDLTDEERLKLASAFLTSDTQKTLEFIEEAALTMTTRLPQDAWLAARNAAIEAYKKELPEQRLAELLQADDGTAEVLELVDMTRESAVDSMREALRGNRVGPAKAAEFIDAYDQARERFEITEDLADEDWKFTVVLPGTIIAHNAFDEAEPVDIAKLRANQAVAELGDALAGAAFEPGFSSIEWDFDGKWLADRDVVLAATSFVPRGK